MGGVTCFALCTYKGLLCGGAPIHGFANSWGVSMSITLLSNCMMIFSKKHVASNTLISTFACWPSSKYTHLECSLLNGEILEVKEDHAHVIINPIECSQVVCDDMKEG